MKFTNTPWPTLPVLILVHCCLIIGGVLSPKIMFRKKESSRPPKREKGASGTSRTLDAACKGPFKEYVTI